MILASNSPRRRQLLEESGFSFEVFTQSFEERYPDDLEPWRVALFLAQAKNAFYRDCLQDQVIITADTTVVCDNKLLEKPMNEEDAAFMLRELSGKTHQVISGVTISNQEKVVSFSEETKVSFKALTQVEIDHYVSKFQPLDKAGAYGIQEWIGLIGVNKLEGSYFNVVGLPTHQVYLHLTQDFDIWPG